MTVSAQQPSRNLPIVRDAEAEQLLRDYATPIFRAAGLNAKAPEVILINQDSFNAFVAERSAHLHQCRRADGGGDAERDHRRDRARDRSHRRRASGAAARADRECQDPLRRRHAARRAARSRARRAPATGSATPARAPWACSPGGQELSAAASSPTSARRSRRPTGGGPLSHGDRPVAKGHARRPSARFADSGMFRSRARRPLPHQPPASDRAHRAARDAWRSRARISTRRIRRRCRRATI